MILRALAEWPVDVSRSFMVGDKPSDIDAAQRAGVRAWLFLGGDPDGLPGTGAQVLPA